MFKFSAVASRDFSELDIKNVYKALATLICFTFGSDFCLNTLLRLIHKKISLYSNIESL